MTFDASPYNREWFQYLEQFNPFLETAFYGILAHLGKPRTLLDLGCGTGYIVDTARLMNIYPAVGVEVSAEALRFAHPNADIIVHDLQEPLNLRFTYDLVLCMEVAEHLPFDKADVLVDTIVLHADKWVVFTAAHEEQGGRWHLNEQPRQYWIDKFTVRGLVYRQDITEHLAETWKWTTGPCSWYHQNLSVFERNGSG